VATVRCRTWGGLVAFALLAVSGCGGGAGNTGPTPTPSAAAAASSEERPPELSLVAIGDSIPYNSSEDCPGCTGFIDRYADAVAEATGRPVETTNLSQHTGLTLPDLMTELDTFEDQLSRADVIVIGIAHNSIAMNADKPCGATFDEATYQLSDWSLVNQDCAQRSAAESRPLYDEMFSKVLAWRLGKPTIIRAINKYNDWIGWMEADLSPAQQERTTLQHDVWNDMLCEVAESHDVPCTDIYHAFNGTDGSTASGDLLAGDYTHPSEKGNEVISKLLIAQGFAPLA
jgi:lysophospholipase L1-like esterase